MIEIFKTNVETEDDAELLKNVLKEIFPQSRITFDLADCDRVLRIETSGEPADLQLATEILFKNGFFCTVLEDKIPQKYPGNELQLRYSFTFKNTH